MTSYIHPWNLTVSKMTISLLNRSFFGGEPSLIFGGWKIVFYHFKVCCLDIKSKKSPHAMGNVAISSHDLCHVPRYRRTRTTHWSCFVSVGWFFARNQGSQDDFCENPQKPIRCERKFYLFPNKISGDMWVFAGVDVESPKVDCNSTEYLSSLPKNQVPWPHGKCWKSEWFIWRKSSAMYDMNPSCVIYPRSTLAGDVD